MNPESGLPDRMPEPPGVVIHSLIDARIVLDAAGDLPVLLLSAPDAACFMGPAWWLGLMEAAIAGRTCTMPHLLDCGDAAGMAMQALRLGQTRLILDPSCPQFDTVMERATAAGATLRTIRPPALDLARYGAERLLHDWLVGAFASPPEQGCDKTGAVG